MKLYELKGIIKNHGNGFTLDIPSLSFEKGKAYAVCGPNAAGKSTLLNILSLLDKPDNGRVILHNGGSMPVSTLLMQQPYLFKTTVAKNVIAGLLFRRVNRRDAVKKAEPLMRELDIWDLRDRHAAALSGGQKKKVALARALVLDTDAVLLDEPTAHIDKESAHSIERIVSRISRENGRTVITATHDLSQAERLASNIIYICEGRIIGNVKNNMKPQVNTDEH